MPTGKRFFVGSKVRGQEISTNIFIIGIYRGMRASFGALIYGRPENTELPEREYTCYKSTMELIIPKRAFDPNNPKITKGDSVIGITPTGLKAVGAYMWKEGKYAYIRGLMEGDSMLDGKHKIKVLHHTLIKST